MKHSDFTDIIRGQLQGHYGGVGATIINEETHDERDKRGDNGKIIAVQYKTRKLKNPRLFVWIDDTSQSMQDGAFPHVGLTMDNPKITERNARCIATRCNNTFKKYFN